MGKKGRKRRKRVAMSRTCKKNAAPVTLFTNGKKKTCWNKGRFRGGAQGEMKGKKYSIPGQRKGGKKNLVKNVSIRGGGPNIGGEMNQFIG